MESFEKLKEEIGKDLRDNLLKNVGKDWEIKTLGEAIESLTSGFLSAYVTGALQGAQVGNSVRETIHELLRSEPNCGHAACMTEH